MAPFLSAALTALMMVFVAVRGLRRAARTAERLFSVGVVGWGAFGAALYQPALFGRFAPTGLAQSHLLVTAFGFGLIALAAFGASLMLGGK